MSLLIDGDTLATHVQDHIANGSSDFTDRLGVAKMPKGYALLLDHDETFFYWLRDDGKQSDVHWNKWAVYRGARENALKVFEGDKP